MDYCGELLTGTFGVISAIAEHGNVGNISHPYGTANPPDLRMVIGTQGCYSRILTSSINNEKSTMLFLEPIARHTGPQLCVTTSEGNRIVLNMIKDL